MTNVSVTSSKWQPVHTPKPLAGAINSQGFVVMDLLHKNLRDGGTVLYNTPSAGCGIRVTGTEAASFTSNHHVVIDTGFMSSVQGPSENRMMYKMLYLLVLCKSTGGSVKKFENVHVQASDTLDLLV